MSSSSPSLKLSGIIVPMVTPLLQDESLDCEGVERLVKHLIAGNVHGIFLLGTAGEGVSCPYEMKTKLIEKTCSVVKGQVPVLVGVTDTCLQTSLDLAHVACSAGANAVVLAPPYYFPMESSQLESYFNRFCRECPLPVLLYNIPICAHNKLDLQLVRRCRDTIPNVIGIKDSSGDRDVFAGLVSEFGNDPNFCILVGTEEMLVDSIRAGADGGVCCLANVVPDLFVQMYTSASRDEDSTVLQEIPKQIVEKFSKVGPKAGWSVLFQGMKAALEIRGVVQRYTLPPLECFDQNQMEKLRVELMPLLEKASAVGSTAVTP